MGKNMKLFVTGATGYIGAHFVKVAAEAGHTVTGTDYNLRQNEIKKYCKEVISWDITKTRKTLATETYDKVIHIAAQTKVPNSVKNPYLYYLTNTIGTKNVIDRAPCEHFIYLSLIHI